MRVEYEGACYHVINRGNYRRRLFEGEGAAEAFVRTLGEAAERFGWRIHAYVVMSNHFHLAVEIGEPNLSEGMKWLQGTWIRRYNGFRRLVGRPFQGRYKALLVEPGHALGQVCHYIHLNPVRAGLVTPERAEDYRWSSLAQWTKSDRPAWLEPRTVLQEAGGLRDTAAGWKRYRSYLEFLATDEPSRREMVAQKLSRGWCVGASEFKTEMRRQARERGAALERFAGLDPTEARRERDELWAEQLARLAQAADIDLAALPAAKSHPSKSLLAAAMKRTTSVSNAWLAEHLAMGRPASASQFARRWLLQDAGRRAVDALVSRVKT